MGKQYAPQNTNRKNSRKKVNIIAIELVVCFVLTVILIGTVIGKYQHQFNSYGSVRALNFYFTSNFLDGKTHTLAPGTQEFSFTLGNHDDELRYSEMDIYYTVTVKDSKGKDATVNTADADGSGNLSKSGVDDDTITIKDLSPGTYIIEAVGNGRTSEDLVGGYFKTLTATIVIPEQGANVYYNIAYPEGDYTLLTIWNEGDTDGEVTIEYTGIPDNTNPNMTGWSRSTDTDTNIKQKVTIKPYTSQTFRFFGDNVTVTVTDKDGKNLETKIPQ